MEFVFNGEEGDPEYCICLRDGLFGTMSLSVEYAAMLRDSLDAAIKAAKEHKSLDARREDIKEAARSLAKWSKKYCDVGHARSSIEAVVGDGGFWFVHGNHPERLTSPHLQSIFISEFYAEIDRREDS